MVRWLLMRAVLRVVVPVATLLVLLSVAGAVETYRAPSTSMEPGLSRGDRFLVWTIGYEPEVGDVAVFRVPAEGEFHGCAAERARGALCARSARGATRTRLVKRVVAGPGDRIRMEAGVLLRNGRRESGYRLRECTGRYVRNCDFPTEIEIPAGHYFVLGDNRDVTADSRDWGPVRAELFEGRKLLTYWKG